MEVKPDSEPGIEGSEKSTALNGALCTTECESGLLPARLEAYSISFNYCVGHNHNLVA